MVEEKPLYKVELGVMLSEISRLVVESNSVNKKTNMDPPCSVQQDTAGPSHTVSRRWSRVLAESSAALVASTRFYVRGILAPLFNRKEKKVDPKSFPPLNKKQHIQTSGRSTWKYGSASFQWRIIPWAESKSVVGPTRENQRMIPVSMSPELNQSDA